jgi:CheY-like chemotaxis protein
MKTLLIVDDEPAIARIVEKVATGCGYRVTTSATAEQFKEELAAAAPDVVVLDLSLPTADGVELLRFMADRACRARILIISGFDPRVLETAGKLGAALGLSIAGTLSKPVRIADLRAALDRIEPQAQS